MSLVSQCLIGEDVARRRFSDQKVIVVSEPFIVVC
jgi:hypothetical protein